MYPPKKHILIQAIGAKGIEMILATRCVVNFYNAGVVNRGRRIGSLPNGYNLDNHHDRVFVRVPKKLCALLAVTVLLVVAITKAYLLPMLVCMYVTLLHGPL
jgi:hypothetical protein